MKPLASVFLILFSINSVYSQNMLLLKSTGKVVIGDTSQMSTPGNYSLYVQNGVLTERVKVSLKSTAEWSDHAFEKCPTIEQVSKTIANQSHLFDMPSAKTLVKDGYELKSMDAKLLEQIEWLWQHVIKLDKENKSLQEEITKLKIAQSTSNK
jgi:hypothetical protein